MIIVIKKIIGSVKKFILILSLISLTSCGNYRDKPKNIELTPQEATEELGKQEQRITATCIEDFDDEDNQYTINSETIEKCIKPKHIDLIREYVGSQDLDLYTLKYDAEIAIRKKVELKQLSPEDAQMLISRSVAEISSELQKRILLRKQAMETNSYSKSMFNFSDNKLSTNQYSQLNPSSGNCEH